MIAKLSSFGKRFWVVGVVVAGALVYHSLTPAFPKETRLLEPVSETLRIGPVAPESEYKHVLRLRNSSNEPIAIDEFVTSCTCADVSPRRVVVPASGEASITLTLDLVRYVTPGRESTIRGDLQIAPVVGGKRLADWTVALALVRPKVLSWPRGEIDFGTVYSHQSAVSSSHVVYVLDEFDSESLEVNTPFAGVRQISLTPGYDGSKEYNEYQLQLLLAPENDRPHGVHRFAVTLRAADSLLKELPCVVRFDTGLRLHVEKRPPVILRPGQEVIWTVRAYRLGEPLDELDVEITDQSRDAARRIEKRQLDNGVWRVDCAIAPREVGNVQYKLRVAATLKNGQRIEHEQPFYFYVPSSSGGA